MSETFTSVDLRCIRETRFNAEPTNFRGVSSIMELFGDIYTYIYIPIYIYTYIYTYINTYIYTYIDCLSIADRYGPARVNTGKEHRAIYL